MADDALTAAPPHAVVAPVQRWGQTNLRDLPWRQTRNPWHILVSETMLQQTQVQRVVGRYHDFLERFPTPQVCAEAPVSAVIDLWAGLGFNRRAVNLWRAAEMIATEYQGEFPDTEGELRNLPGVGPYTARAILVFAFERDVGVLDTNVGRLLARWTGRSLRPKEAQVMADALVPPGDGWSWNQALFDFAVAVCPKREPSCSTCPIATECAWHGVGADPAATSAGVSTPQSKFDGSERQVRGRIVDALRRGPVGATDLERFARPADTADDMTRIVQSLIDDGLAETNGSDITLPR